MPKSAALMGAAAAAALFAQLTPGEARAIEMPMQTRVAPVNSVDPETRIVTLTWTTGADVNRYDWWSGARYIEQLDLGAGCDLSRLNGGAPLLNSHEVYDLGAQIGVVERAWIEKGEGLAQVRFPKEGVDPAADMIFKKVSDKIIRNVSVGYTVRKYQITDNQGDGLDVWRAVDWTPMEISLVTIPADAGAGVRSESERMHTCEFTRAAPATTEETPMPEVRETAPANVVSTEEHTRAIASAQAAERQRVLDIQGRVAAAGLPIEVANDLIGRGVAAEHAGNHILDEIAKRGTAPIVPAGGGARETGDSRQVRRDAIANALMHRAQPGAVQITEAAREWRGLRMMEIVRELLTIDGEKVRGLGPMDLATRAFMTTGDFANILANVANKSLQAGYGAEIRTFQPFSTRHDVVDFKQISSVSMGEGSSLELVNEHGEFKRGSISDGAEKYQLATYGKVFPFSRQALINDDLSAFTRLPRMFGSAGVRLENDTVWGIITANAVMSDNVALFHATHGNLQTGGGTVLSNTALGTMRQKMRTQKGKDAKQTLNLLPKIVAVPAALETTLEQLLTTLLYASASSNIVTDFMRSLTPVVEARLDTNSTTAWYGFCDPGQLESIEYAYLEGQDGVYLETRVGFDVDGVEFKVRHDFAAKAVNSIGMQKMAGA